MSGDGSQEIIAQVARIVAGLQGPAIEEAGAAWVELDAKPRAQALVPVLTGATRDGIDGVAGPGGVTMFAATDYAPDIEFGTSQRAAQPFLKPAMRQTLGRFGDHLLAAINRRK